MVIDGTTAWTASPAKASGFSSASPTIWPLVAATTISPPPMTISSPESTALMRSLSMAKTVCRTISSKRLPGTGMARTSLGKNETWGKLSPTITGIW